MTIQAEKLLGAQITDADGKAVGTVEQVFRNDADGTPTWARIRSGSAARFVPLGGSQATAGGLSVPYGMQKIMAGPEIAAGDHMSAAEAEELSRYFGLLPAASDQPGRSQQTDDGWLELQEERLEVGTEMLESGRVRLHRYVDIEPVDQAVHVYHEEFAVERRPIADGHTHDFAEAEQEIILHEERPVLRKELTPVERVRLVARRVEEDTPVHDEVRRERIEVEPGQQLDGAGTLGRGPDQRR
jgi:uncharacterized protein (TIGR02271 family)